MAYLWIKSLVGLVFVIKLVGWMVGESKVMAVVCSTFLPTLFCFFLFLRWSLHFSSNSIVVDISIEGSSIYCFGGFATRMTCSHVKQLCNVNTLTFLHSKWWNNWREKGIIVTAISVWIDRFVFHIDIEGGGIQFWWTCFDG